LNSFDYTDVYRPELFLGGFISTSEELRKLRFKTISSHTNIRKEDKRYSQKPHGVMYQKVLNELEDSNDGKWQADIKEMISAYFIDMEKILTQLFLLGQKEAQLWLIVANSAYSNVEVPTDLILSDIATKVGWKLKEIGVLRTITKRGSKYSPDISTLRESAIILYK
jgi:hypothetical protein